MAVPPENKVIWVQGVSYLCGKIFAYEVMMLIECVDLCCMLVGMGG